MGSRSCPCTAPRFCAAFQVPVFRVPRKLLPLVLTNAAQLFIRPFGRSREVADLALGSPQTLRREARYFLANPLQFVLAHARLNLVDIYRGGGVRNGIARRGMHPASARDARRQQLGIFFDKLSQIFTHRFLILSIATYQSPVFAPDNVVLHGSKRQVDLGHAHPLQFCPDLRVTIGLFDGGLSPPVFFHKMIQACLQCLPFSALFEQFGLVSRLGFALLRPDKFLDYVSHDVANPGRRCCLFVFNLFGHTLLTLSVSAVLVNGEACLAPTQLASPPLARFRSRSAPLLLGERRTDISGPVSDRSVALTLVNRSRAAAVSGRLSAPFRNRRHRIRRVPKPKP